MKTVSSVTMVLFAGAILLITAAGARAANWTVTKTPDTDDGVCDADCSLREAINVAAAGDVVVFSSLFNTPQVITLSTASPLNGGLTISKNLVIAGPGADLLSVNGVSNIVFLISSGSNVHLSGLTIGNGWGITNNGSMSVSECVVTGNDRGITNHGAMTITDSTITDDAGALFAWAVDNDGELSVVNSTISNNSDGGISNSGTLVLVNSTISGNGSLGLINYSPGTTALTLCTITNNGSGIEAVGGTVTLRGTIVAANNALPDVFTSIFVVTVTSYGYNLIGNDSTGVFFNVGDQAGTGAAPIDPRLDPLGDYGGMTETHRLQSNSPAIDKGNSFGENTDQRGSTRPFDKPNYSNVPAGDGSDIGAYELQFGIVISGRIFDLHSIPLKNVRVLIRSATGEHHATKTDRFGIYSFENVPRNRAYQVSPIHRLYDFTPRIVMVGEANISNLDFMPLP